MSGKGLDSFFWSLVATLVSILVAKGLKGGASFPRTFGGRFFICCLGLACMLGSYLDFNILSGEGGDWCQYDSSFVLGGLRGTVASTLLEGLIRAKLYRNKQHPWGHFTFCTPDAQP